jgi:hypothetical protein
LEPAHEHVSVIHPQLLAPVTEREPARSDSGANVAAIQLVWFTYGQLSQGRFRYLAVASIGYRFTSFYLQRSLPALSGWPFEKKLLSAEGLPHDCH